MRIRGLNLAPCYTWDIYIFDCVCQVTKECDNGAKQMADVEMLTNIDRKLEFKHGMKVG